MKLIKILALAAFGVASLGLSSCCCSGEASVPPLRPLPKLKDIPVNEIPVDPAK